MLTEAVGLVPFPPFFFQNVGCPHSVSLGEEVLSDWDDSDDDDAAAPLAEAVSKVKLDDEDHDDWEDRA